MAASFFWYDLETSGIDPRDARIMQFAGQRTDRNLEVIGEPVNILIRMTDEILPDPDAVLLTGITPQATIADGMSEAEFLRVFSETISTPDTIFVGYNSIHFDDEFMRFMQYRNFYDPYEWQWRDGRSRWDLLDVIRMTRALRPEGISWPVDDNGKATNRLELLTAANGLSHEHAHDALNDVMACIYLSKLICEKQPKLFNYLLDIRDKSKVAALITSGDPFVYTNGGYPTEFEKTTMAIMVVGDAKSREALVYDLRHDPSTYRNMNAAQLAEAWRYKKEDPANRLPVRSVAFNKCPAIAPAGVLDAAAQKRLQIDLKTIEHHLAILKSMSDFPEKLKAANELLAKSWDTKSATDPDTQLYDGFVDNGDRDLFPKVRSAALEGKTEFSGLHDARLQALFPRYIARNFPTTMSAEQREAWESFRSNRLLEGGENSRFGKFAKRLQALASEKKLTQDQRYLLEELQLYAESIMPNDAF
jgi:exodeoxyribonuclease-1